MNIYRIIEDGQDSLIRANTMPEAVEISLARYLDDPELKNGDFTMEVEAEHYHAEILQTCELLGELKN